MLRPAIALLLVAGVLVAGCGGGGDGATSGTTAPPPSQTITSTTSTTPPTSVGAASTTTLLDPELGCLRTALGDRPGLLAALDAPKPRPQDLVRAVVVARDCLEAPQLGAALVDGLRATLAIEISDFQAECLADQLLALEDGELTALLVAAAGDPTKERLAARVLARCEVER